MSKRSFEEITNYLYYNNDQEKKRRRIESNYTLWQSKMNKYNNNDLFLLEKFKKAGFDFYKIWNSQINNINNTFNNSKYYNYKTNKFEMKPILYISIVKLKNDSYKLKIGSTADLEDNTKSKGLRLERFKTHELNFDGHYCYMMIPIEGRHIEENFHDYMKTNYPELIVKNAYNKKNKKTDEIYELNHEIIDICLDFIKN